MDWEFDIRCTMFGVNTVVDYEGINLVGCVMSLFCRDCSSLRAFFDLESGPCVPYSV